jgi:hypothetical protein
MSAGPFSTLPARFPDPLCRHDGEDGFCLAQAEPQICVVEFFGQVTPDLLGHVEGDLSALMNRSENHAVVVLVDHVSGIDEDLRHIYRDADWRPKMAPINAVVTQNGYSKVVVDTMAIGARIIARRVLGSAPTLEAGLDKARAELSRLNAGGMAPPS